jgi:hypothetical protein
MGEQPGPGKSQHHGPAEPAAKQRPRDFHGQCDRVTGSETDDLHTREHGTAQTPDHSWDTKAPPAGGAAGTAFLELYQKGADVCRPRLRPSRRSRAAPNRRSRWDAGDG